MILTFSEPKFEQQLRDGWKGTTFREDKNDRWKVGMKAHMWMHNPRNVRLNPHHIKDDIIYSIDYVVFIPVKGILKIYENEKRKKADIIFSEKRNLKRLNCIAKTDGFLDFKEMKQWFLKHGYTDPKGYKMKRLWFESYFDDLPF